MRWILGVLLALPGVGLAQCPTADDLVDGIRVDYANGGYWQVRAAPNVPDGQEAVFVWDPEQAGQILRIVNGVYITHLHVDDGGPLPAADAWFARFVLTPPPGGLPDPAPEAQVEVSVRQITEFQEMEMPATYRWEAEARVDIGACSFTAWPLFHIQEELETDYIYLPELGLAYLRAQRLDGDPVLDLTPAAIGVVE